METQSCEQDCFREADGQRPTEAKVDGKVVKLDQESVGKSHYAIVTLPAGVHELAVTYAKSN